MTVTLSQAATLITASTGGNRTSTFSANPTAGDKVLVGVFGYASSAPTSCTDNASNTYTLDHSATAHPTDTSHRIYIYRADSIALPGAGTLAVTVNMADAGSVQAVAYTGAASGAPTATNTNYSSTNVTSGNSGAAGSATSALHFAAVTGSHGGNPENIATTSPFVQQGAEQNGSTSQCGAISDQLNALASQTCSWTWTGGSAVYSAAIVAYAASDGGAPADQLRVPVQTIQVP